MMINITGTGSALPEKRVTNFDVAELVETSDEWIRERTGIIERRIATQDTVASLSAKACRQALEMAGKEAQDVDVIIVATCSPEMFLPCAACQVQGILGAKNALAFDISAACSGFVYALSVVYAYMQAGFYKNALIVGAEVLSKMVDWTDRSTCVLFGDGAGAAFVEACEDREDRTGVISLSLGSDGAKGMVLSCGARDLANPYVKEIEETRKFVHMDGQEVYKFAVRQVPVCIQDALKKANLTVDDIDHFVLHQANIRIIEAVAKRLKADISKFPVNVDRVANMSAATIPVLLDELNRKGKLHKGEKLVLSGFGAGLTYGACVLIWN